MFSSSLGIFSPKTVSIGDLFLGAIVPGLILVFLYSVYLLLTSQSIKETEARVLDSNAIYTALKNLLPPVVLIIAVLGSILGGFATPTEAAGVGAFGATLLAIFKGKLNLFTLNVVSKNTVKVTSMVFFILIGAAIFSLVFRGFGGDTLVENFFVFTPIYLKIETKQVHRSINPIQGGL